MITRLRAFVTGMAALAVLAAIVGGLPVVLYRFGGSPLPARLPGWHELGRRLASPDDDGAALTVIRDCAWLAWLLFTGCVLAEAQAALRGCRAPRLRLGGMQGAAAQLVALAALAFTAPAAITLSGPVAVMTGQTLDRMAIPDSTMSSPVVIVQPGDCLWSIAQRYLGAGDRYPEIAALNYGRDMGHGELFTNPAVIYPGWRLLLPPGTTLEPQSAIGQPASAPHSGHASNDLHFRRRHQTAHDQAGNVAVGTGGSAPAQAMTAGPGSAAMVAGPRPTAAQVGSRTPDEAAALSQATVFITGALAGAIVTTLTRLRFRQRQVRRHGRRIALPATADALATEQRLRTAASNDSAQTLQQALACMEAGLLATGQLVPDIVGLHVTPDLLEVFLAAPAVDAPPAPFEVSPGRQGMCWQLAPSAVVAPANPCHLLPGLVTAGATDDGYLLLDLESLQVTGCDGPQALVDQVIATMAAELTTGQWSGWYDLILVGFDELASAGRAEHCATVDLALSLLESRFASTSQRLAERAPMDVRELRLAEPDNEDWGLTVLVSRAEPSADELTRLLHLAMDNSGGLAALVAGDAEASDGRMAPTVMQLAPDPEVSDGIVANVVPLQLTVRPRALSQADYDAIAALFSAAANVSDVSAEDLPYAYYGAPPWIPHAAALRPDADSGAAWVDDEDGAAQPLARAGDSERPGDQIGEAEPPGDLGDDTGPPADDPPVYRPGALLTGPSQRHPRPGRLEVGILGPFVVTGTAEQVQPKQAELMLALALAAPGGLANSALCTMLGADPDHAKPADAVRQIITRTRRRLGTASDGQEYIIHTGNGQYLLHPEVSLDWSRFCELARSGQADDLRSALALVRGQPFTGSYFWWIDIPLIETVRAEVVDAAETLAEAELAAGSPRAAAWAARTGLSAEASAEQLWRLVMRAEHAAGNLAGVTEAWLRCLDAIEDIVPSGEPHPATAALYRQLTVRSPQHAHMG